MEELAIKIEHVSKEYRLGAIGGGTLRGDLQSWWAKVQRKEDPNAKIGDAKKVVNGNTRFLALNDVSFEVKKGEALGIIGHNGAGKSTLLKLLSRVTAPTKGKISYNGRIASMLEVGTGFHPELTGRENVYMNGAILGMTKAEIDKKFDQIVEFAEMEQFIDTPVKRYSSGMYVKLAFSVAAHLDSEIMIMDEVLAVGDMAFQKKCLDKMRDAAKKEGRTVLYVSHNMNTIRQLCDRCVVLDKGKVVFDGTVDAAISVYMATNNDILNMHYDVGNLERTSDGYGEKIHINSFEFANDRSCPRFFSNEEMKFKIDWTGIKYAGDLRVRMEIFNGDTTIAGMAESKVFSSRYEGRDNINYFSFQLKNLTAGSYYFRLSVFVLGDGGIHMGLDDVRNIRFEIEEHTADRTRWLKQYWGSIRFDDIEVIREDA